MSDYGTLAGADTYHTGNATWEAYTDAVKNAALDAASIYLDVGFFWKGVIAESDQDNAWPRAGVYDLEGRYVASDSVPTPIVNAFYEIALIDAAGSLYDQDGSVLKSKAVAAGSVSSSKTYTTYKILPNHGEYVSAMLKPYYQSSRYIGRA